MLAVRLFALVLVVCFLANSVGAQTLASENKEKEAAAANFAANWLKLVDAAKYSDAWKQTSPSLQSSVKKDQWQSEISKSRKLLGKIRIRRILSATYTTKLPGAEDGEYVVVTFFASFEKLGSGIETVVPQLAPDGSWSISGYSVKPADTTE